MSDSQFEPLRKQIKIDLPKTEIMNLPNEILIKIFKYLETESIHLNVAIVCKRFMNITRLPVFCETYSLAIWPIFVNYKVGYKLVDFCLNRIKKVLKVFPDCKLELCYSSEEAEDEGSRGFFSSVKDLAPFQTSIVKLYLTFQGRLSSSDFSISKNISFANVKRLEMKINHYWSEGSFYISGALDSTLWHSFPNLASLKIEDASSPDNEVSKYFIALFIHN